MHVSQISSHDSVGGEPVSPRSPLGAAADYESPGRVALRRASLVDGGEQRVAAADHPGRHVRRAVERVLSPGDWPGWMRPAPK